jgi:hypothetical protein
MTIDERLEFLLKSSESLHANMQEMISEQEKRWKEQDLRWAKTDARIDKLTNVMAAVISTVIDHEERLGGTAE